MLPPRHSPRRRVFCCCAMSSCWLMMLAGARARGRVRRVEGGGLHGFGGLLMRAEGIGAGAGRGGGADARFYSSQSVDHLTDNQVGSQRLRVHATKWVGGGTEHGLYEGLA